MLTQPVMIKEIITCMLLLIANLLIAQSKDIDSIYINPEMQAKFKYSDEELNQFISVNLIVPYEARYYGANGEVELHYVIDTNGRIVDIKVNREVVDPAKGVDIKKYIKDEEVKGFFSTEAKRVVMLLDKLYFPAKHNGHNVNSALSIKLKFSTKQYDENERAFHQQKRYLRNNPYYIMKFNFGTYTINQPDYSQIRYDYGVAKMSENKIEIACKYFEEAIRLNSKYVDAYYNLGIACIKLNKVTEACEAWNKCMQLGDTGTQELISRYCNK